MQLYILLRSINMEATDNNTTKTRSTEQDTDQPDKTRKLRIQLVLQHTKLQKEGKVGEPNPTQILLTQQQTPPRTPQTQLYHRLSIKK